MKIFCRCGYILSDNTDTISYKAHIIPDQDWFDVWDKIEAAVKSENPDKERLMRELMSDVNHITRTMYQCPECGRLYVDDLQYELHEFKPQEQIDAKMLKSKYYKGGMQNGCDKRETQG